jgi:hypothetical protein
MNEETEGVPSQGRYLSLFYLVLGLAVTSAGVYGVYYQGPFWASGIIASLNPDEDGKAFGLPVCVTVSGALTVSYVLLHSPLAVGWSGTRRTVLFACFAILTVVACWLAAQRAGSIAAEKLKTTGAFTETVSCYAQSSFQTKGEQNGCRQRLEGYLSCFHSPPLAVA